MYWKILNSDALGDLVLFAQFKKRGKHPWRIVTFSKVAGFKPGNVWNQKVK